MAKMNAGQIKGAKDVLALLNAGNLDAAKSLGERLLHSQNKPDLFFVMQKIALLQEDAQNAIDYGQKMLKLAPYQAEFKAAYHEMINHFHRQRQFSMMLEAASWLTQSRSADGQAWNLLGISYIELGRFDEARQALERALAMMPNNKHVMSNLGNVLISMSCYGAAIDYLEQALQIQPDLVPACNNLGNAYRYAGRVTDAIKIYEHALKIAPDYAELIANLGVAYSQVQRYRDAIDCYDRALNLNPQLLPVYANRAEAFRLLGQLQDAIAACETALNQHLDIQEVWLVYGNALRDASRIDEAIEAYIRALSYQNLRNTSFNSAVYTSLLFCLNYQPDLSAELIYGVYQDYNVKNGLPYRDHWRPFLNDQSLSRKLKIGYVSQSFYNHVCKHFLLPLIENHNHDNVEIYAYSNSVRDDEYTALYRNAVDHWIVTNAMSDDEMAERIRADGIDVLIDVAGHTSDNRLLVMARKPAPVSLHWLDFGYTTGLTAIDYYLTDHAGITEDCAQLFSEKLWPLDGPFFVYRPFGVNSMGEAGQLPAERNEYVTFGCLSRSIRINHKVIRIWAAILDAMPTARLIIDSGDFKDPQICEEMAARFAAYGIQRDRLDIGFHTPPWDVLRNIDISLDCFPHNSGMTLIESLYMGVPFITLAGRPSVGRLGASILTGAGHPEWIAYSEEEYAQKCVILAHDLPGLKHIRQNLRQELEQSLVMNEPAFARSVEAAYRQMWEIYCKGQQA